MQLPSAERWLEVASQLFKSYSDHSAAARALEKALAMDPRNKLARSIYAAMLYDAGEMHRFDPKLIPEPDREEAALILRHRVKDMCDRKDFNGALRCLNEATISGLNLPETWLLQGVCHLYRGKPAEALPYLERAVGHFTTSDARLALTDAYLRLGMKQQAGESLKILDPMLEGADRSELLESRIKQLASLG